MSQQQPRFFVSLDNDGQPIGQRSSVRDRPYQSASFDGASFSSSTPNGAYPRKVKQLEQPIEWVSYVTRGDGKKVWDRSKQGPTGRNYLRYSFVRNGYNVRVAGVDPDRTERECWTNQSQADWLASHNRKGAAALAYELIEYVADATREIRNWPATGDSVVLP